MSNYAKGRIAIAECQRCGFRYRLSQLSSDGQYPNVLVCRDCWSKKNEAEYPINLTDATALYRPAPNLDAVNSRVLADTTPIADITFPGPGQPFFGGGT